MTAHVVYPIVVSIAWHWHVQLCSGLFYALNAEGPEILP